MPEQAICSSFYLWREIANTTDEALKKFENTCLIYTLTKRRNFARMLLNQHSTTINEDEEKMMAFYNNEIKRVLLIP